ncbi:P-loop containing nucleoside triphosphate hydrolase protein [Pseudomassariella vexata]|uniref:p-loop containing nucleoside triphosphate hydrolase protein n=1 Tax=Pseudomassariella vexata TaxID=1141098 RepID=A0A1Y2EIE1_9PEZI|nr:P-loop containing nucleoside triphosphate hydrolase protein [Pseudomassariella vexata]ORY71333.1 P-loop containing nucleoside triphosphate hydrolase protein [Pseudomassariella vexata]
MSQPFHAAGAACHTLHDPWTHGLGVMRAVIGRWLELDITHLGSIITIAGAAPAAWRFVQHIGRHAYGWIRRFFIASVTIPGGDPLNRNVVNWVLSNVIEPQNIRFLTARTEVGRNGADRAAALKKTRRAVQYCPHWKTTWFWHQGNLFMITRILDGFSASMGDPTYDGIGGEELTISCLGRSVEPIRRLMTTCREFADRQTQFFVIVYSRDRYGMSWKPKSRKPIRLLETVHFDEQVKQELLADIKNYLDPKTQRRYQTRSMPYRRGYLFYGPPGTGKSSLSTALAGEFGLDLYEVNIPSIASDADLEQMFLEVPPQCIVLLEDIDAVWVERETEKSEQNGNRRSNCTLSGLLNVLDGVGSQEGRIVIMTTNRPEQLDSALVRPGRVDMKIFLSYISQKSAEQMFVRMFAIDLDSQPRLPRKKKDLAGQEVPRQLDIHEVRSLASKFATEIPEDTFTPSQLQGFFQLHLDSAVDAAACISSWVEKELSRKSDQDFEIVRNGKE